MQPLFCFVLQSFVNFYFAQLLTVFDFALFLFKIINETNLQNGFLRFFDVVIDFEYCIYSIRSRFLYVLKFQHSWRLRTGYSSNEILVIVASRLRFLHSRWFKSSMLITIHHSISSVFMANVLFLSMKPARIFRFLTVLVVCRKLPF